MGNAVCCVLLLVLQCVVQCFGDILEYFSEWAYVQCAVRGTSFMDSARITYSLMTCASLEYVVQDLLVNSVVNLGAFICAGAGCMAGVGIGFFVGVSKSNAKVMGAVLGSWVGLLAGGAAMSVISSGIKTILAL